MTRPIKFRAWDNEQKKMCYKVYAGHDGWHGEYWDEVTMISAFSDNNNPGNVLMQFTGLTDKIGKEIWEGDIMAAEHDLETVHVVDWNEKLAAFNIYIQYPGEFPYQIVLGNIYENPELLK